LSSDSFQLSCDDIRRRQLLQSSALNGINYLEVVPPGSTTDLPLLVVFLYHSLPQAPSPSPLGPKNLLITGGARITNIGIEWVYRFNELNSVDSTLQGLITANVSVPDPTQVIVVRPTSDGDFSTYTLQLVDSANPSQPPSGFDPLLSQTPFGFKVECPQNFDCNPGQVCPPEPLQEPVIDYLTKDFNSFKTLMLNRLALINPGWQETHAADMGVALVELLAYVGDQLSYYQDAVSTEAYLGTARRRISIKRHARLLDYFMHDGCNARAWVTMQIDQSSDGLLVPKGTGLLTGGVAGGAAAVTANLADALVGATVFETMSDVTLYSAKNEIQFYTWQEEECCLPSGSTSATLVNAGNALDVQVFVWGNVPGSDSAALAAFLGTNYGASWVSGYPFVNDPSTNTITVTDGLHSISIALSSDKSKAAVDIDGGQVDEFVVANVGGNLEVSAHRLRVGEVLIFEETHSPTTGTAADADPTHRCAVRLTSITASVDPLDSSSTPLLDIAWDPADAPPFPLCLETVQDPDNNQPEPVSVARGNVVLADHGQTQALQPPPVGSGYLDPNGNPYVGCTEFLGNTPKQAGEVEGDGDEEPAGLKFRPGLSYQPLTFGFASQYDQSAPASSVYNYDVRKALPNLTILGDNLVWLPARERDLFSSGPSATAFVVEVDNDGTAYIRFGDDVMGRAPNPSSKHDPNRFYAIYRIGNGAAGNVGAEAISRIVSSSIYGTCTQSPPFDASRVQLVRNPMPAQGGVDPEDMEDVRQFAPYAFNSQQRAVTPQDYENILQQYPGVLQAYAQLEWTGSWWTYFISVDRTGGLAVDDSFKAGVEAYLNSYRMAGYDLEITNPVIIPLDIEMHVCVASGYSPDAIRQELLQVFSSKVNPDGSQGFFYPDNFTFGQTVYLSPIYQAAVAVTGVTSVVVDVFQRFGVSPNGELQAGEIKMAASEVARLANDPDFPENGIIKITVDGTDTAVGVGSSS
jgi:hypothetical protein